MLTLSLDHSLPTSIYEQIYLKIKTMIKEGELSPGDKLPSERSLSLHLQVSRSTVNLAYLQLLSEGYIYSKPKSGYYVANIEHTATKAIPTFAQNISSFNKQLQNAPKYDFSPFSLYTDGFPYRTWERLYRLCMKENGKNLFFLGDKQGDFALRASIAKYLYEFRGFSTNPDNIVIGAGAGYLLQLINQLFPKEHSIAMENPSYQQAYKIFSSLGRKITPISLTEYGVKIQNLHTSSASIAYLSPSHQFPMGFVMPIKERLELYAWALEKEERYIIEDDHDSEFRYKGKPIPSIKENDKFDKVIHLGTFSRTIAPAIRIGFMVLPDKLLEVYKKVSGFYASTVPRIEQAVLTEFISGGCYERHINKCRKVYRTRHDALISALKPFEKKLEIFGENAGVHLAVKFHYPFREEEIIQKALTQGISLHGLSPYFITKKERERYQKGNPIFLMGYGNMAEEEISEGISILFRLLET